METASHISLTFLLFFSFCAHSMQKTSEPLSPSATQSILSFFTTTGFNVGSFLLEVLTFDPQKHQARARSYAKRRNLSTTTRISDQLVIVAPSGISVKKNGHYLTINGEYYDSTLKGKLYYGKTGRLINKKGTIIDPLV